MIQGERSFDLVVRLQEPFRQNMEAIKNILVATADGQHLPLSQFATIKVSKGASFIYREVELAVRRHPVQRGGARPGERRRGRAEKGARRPCTLPSGYTYDWGGEYKEYLAARSQMGLILPLTIVVILLILFALYGNLKFPLIIMFSVLVTVPVGGLLALKLTGTNFSVSSGFGFVALMGVAVQTSVILYSFINKLRLEGKSILVVDARGVAAAVAADHDDRTGRLPRPAAGGDVHRHRQRLTEAVCNRDRRRHGVAACCSRSFSRRSSTHSSRKTTTCSRYSL